MKIKISSILLSLPFLLIGMTQAQLPYNPPFGDLNVEDIEIESFDDYPDASAVLLLNFRAVSFAPSVARPVVDYYVFKRYKILDEKGLKLAKQLITINTDEESLVGIRAATYQLNPQGQVVSYKVKKNRIKKIKPERGKKQYSFNLPVVRVGSVIEIAIHTQRKNYNRLEDWAFQSEYPVVRAEHHAYLPSAFDYSRILKGDVSEIGQAVVPFSVTPTSLPMQNFTGNRVNQLPSRRVPRIFFGKHEILVLQNLPSIKKERFSPEESNFIPNVAYQLKRDLYFGQTGSKVFQGWADVYKYLDRKYQPRRLKAKPSQWSQDMRRDLAKVDRSPSRELAVAMVASIKKKVRWDSSLTILPTRLDQSWEKRRGSGAAINMMAYFLFKEKGFDVYPILISTRDHGEIQPNVSYLDQFNHLILGLMVDEEMLLLDLVNGQESLDLLPERDLNQLGFMLGREGFRWIPLRLQNPTIRYTYSRFKLDETGEMKGQIEEKHRKQSLADVQKQLEEVGKDPAAYWENIQFSGLEETSFISGNQQVDQAPETLSLRCEVSTGDFTEGSSDVLIVSPMMIRQIKENPFTQENRATPVDLTHPLRESHLLGLEIPEGYEVVQAPEPTRVLLPNDGGVFVYNFTQMDNIIHVSSSIFLNQTIFLPREYPNLKQFFELVVSKHQEDIILSRKK